MVHKLLFEHGRVAVKVRFEKLLNKFANKFALTRSRTHTNVRGAFWGFRMVSAYGEPYPGGGHVFFLLRAILVTGLMMDRVQTGAGIPTAQVCWHGTRPPVI